MRSLAAEQRVPVKKLADLQSLGPARGSVTNGGATVTIAMLTFVTVFGLCFGGLLGIGRFAPPVICLAATAAVRRARGPDGPLAAHDAAAPMDVRGLSRPDLAHAVQQHRDGRLAPDRAPARPARAARSGGHLDPRTRGRRPNRAEAADDLGAPRDRGSAGVRLPERRRRRALSEPIARARPLAQEAPADALLRDLVPHRVERDSARRGAELHDLHAGARDHRRAWDAPRVPEVLQPVLDALGQAASRRLHHRGQRRRRRDRPHRAAPGARPGRGAAGGRRDALDGAADRARPRAARAPRAPADALQPRHHRADRRGVRDLPQERPGRARLRRVRARVLPPPRAAAPGAARDGHADHREHARAGRHRVDDPAVHALRRRPRCPPSATAHRTTTRSARTSGATSCSGAGGAATTTRATASWIRRSCCGRSRPACSGCSRSCSSGSAWSRPRARRSPPATRDRADRAHRRAGRGGVPRRCAGCSTSSRSRTRHTSSCTWSGS